jgi:opacity protein-like surface antigen
MSVRTWLLASSLVAVVSAAAPPTASADWTITPFAGWNFGGAADINTGSSGSQTSSTFERKVDYGVSLARMGTGPIGFEIDFGYSPTFFETSTPPSGFFKFTPDSNVTTLTGNVIIGPRGGSIRPYVVAGGGLIRTKLQDLRLLFSLKSKNDLGLDIGGGVMGFFSDNVGLRGDLRYFRSLEGTSYSENPGGVALSDFKFWRAPLGLSLKF